MEQSLQQREHHAASTRLCRASPLQAAHRVLSRASAQTSHLPNGQETKLQPLQALQHLPVQELLSEDSTGLTPPT